jgi:hypothetical protein
VSHTVLMIPGALGGRRRPSYLAPALSEIVPAGGPLQTRAALTNGVSLVGKFDASSPPAPSTYAGTGTVRMVW